MVTVDQELCVGCGTCVTFCPREALWAWGVCRADAQRCTDCYDGLYHFDPKAAVGDRKSLLDRTKTSWRRNCIGNCPVDALSVKET